jgi:hypothetical protein
MVDERSQPTCFKNKHFLAKTVVTVNPQDKEDYEDEESAISLTINKKKR